jgi:hypothetical protein
MIFKIKILFLILLIGYIYCKRTQGLLIYDNNHKTTNGFGVYTNTMQLKNITQGYPKKGSLIKGTLATDYNGDYYIIIYGKLSFYQNTTLNNIIFYKRGREWMTLSNNLVSNSIDSVIMVSNKFIFTGDIISLDGSMAYNSIICDLNIHCSLLNDGNRIGIPGYLDMLSTSSDGERKAFFVYNKNEGKKKKSSH